MNAVSIKKVTVTGSTGWDSEEYRTVGRFRGRATICAQVKDEKGKPAMKASRWVNVWVRCCDDVVYRFAHHVTSDDLAADPRCSIRVHGREHDVRLQDIPAPVGRAYRLAIRRCRAIERLMKAEIAALPKYKLLPSQQKVA